MPENNVQQTPSVAPQSQPDADEQVSIGPMLGGARRALVGAVSNTVSGSKKTIEPFARPLANTTQSTPNLGKPPIAGSSAQGTPQVSTQPAVGISPPTPSEQQPTAVKNAPAEEAATDRVQQPEESQENKEPEAPQLTDTESSKETDGYLFKYVSPEGEPYAALTGPAEDIYTRLTKNEEVWNRFVGNVQAVDSVQKIFDKLSDPNLSPTEKDALYVQLRSRDPRLFQALTWAAAVKQNPDEAIKNPRESIEHSRTLLEFGALRYASKGGRLTNRLNELQYQYEQATGEQKEAIAQEINAIKDMMAQRYASLYSKALGDQELTPEDLDLVYYNFAQETGLKDMKTDPEYVRQGIQEWFMNPDVGPLPKMGVLLGVPATIIGILQMLTQGYSTGALLLTLLGGMGMMFGGQQWLSSKKQVSPGSPIIRGNLTSPYLENPES